MRNVYKNSRKTWTEDTKQNGLRKKDLRNKIIANVIAHFAFIIEETQSMYKPNVQNSLSEIVNYRQSGYFFEKNCKKVLQNAQRCYILKLRKRLSYKTGRTE